MLESDLGGPIDPESTEGFRVRQLIKTYKYLNALTRNNSGTMTHWFRTKNRQLRLAPIDLMQTEQGLNEITS